MPNKSIKYRKPNGLLKLLAGLAIAALAASGLRAEVAIEKPADLRVLIDVSGSMKQNDPRNLRRPALDLLLNLLPDDSRAGVWTFGRYVNMLVPHEVVDNQWRSQAESKSSLINSVALHTNIGLALEKANYDSDPKLFPSSLKYDRAVILLTDGVVDIDSEPSVNQAERERIRDELLNAYQQAGVAIYTVALSTNADAELLEFLSESTGGSFAIAEDASDLDRIFLAMLDRAAPADRVPLENNRFTIDSSIEEFTALVFRKPGSDKTSLLSPDGERYDSNSQGASLRWLQTESYDLVTIAQPVEGEWQIDSEIDPDNRVSIVSNLALQVSAPATPFYVDEESEITVNVTQNGETISDQRFLDLLDVRLSLQSLAASEPATIFESALAREQLDIGSYSDVLRHPSSAGDYNLTVQVDGKTFQREKTLSLTAERSFIVDSSYNEEDNSAVITVTARNPAWSVENVQLSGRATVNDEAEHVLAFQYSDKTTWRAEFEIVESGTHRVVLTATDGKRSVALPTISLDVPARANLAAPQATPLPEPAPAQVENLEPAPEPTQPPASEPEVDTAQPEAPETAEVAMDETSEESTVNWTWIIVGLVAGNLVLLGALYLVYRKITAPAVSVATVFDAQDLEAEPEAPAVTEAAAIEEIAEDEDVSEQAVEQAEEIPEVGEDITNRQADEASSEDELEAVNKSTAESSTDEVTGLADQGDNIEDDLEKTVSSGSELESDAAGANLDELPVESDTELAAELDQLIDELGEDLAAQLEEEPVSGEALEEANPETADEARPKEQADAGAAGITAEEESDTDSDDDDEITLDFDGEFDLSTDISEDLKKHSK